MTCYIPRWFTRPQAVTHPSTNRAQCRLTLLIKPTPLTTILRRHPTGCGEYHTACLQWSSLKDVSETGRRNRTTMHRDIINTQYTHRYTPFQRAIISVWLVASLILSLQSSLSWASSQDRPKLHTLILCYAMYAVVIFAHCNSKATVTGIQSEKNFIWQQKDVSVSKWSLLSSIMYNAVKPTKILSSIISKWSEFCCSQCPLINYAWFHLVHAINATLHKQPLTFGLSQM